MPGKITRINVERRASIRYLTEAEEARRGPAGYPRRPSFIVDSYQIHITAPGERPAARVRASTCPDRCHLRSSERSFADAREKHSTEADPVIDRLGLSLLAGRGRRVEHGGAQRSTKGRPEGWMETVVHPRALLPSLCAPPCFTASGSGAAGAGGFRAGRSGQKFLGVNRQGLWPRFVHLSV